MESLVLRGKPIVEGVAEGEALVTRGPMQFLGPIDPFSGTIMASPDQELKGKSLSGRILVFSAEVGSTGDPLGFYLLKRAGTGPKAIVCSTRGQMPVVSSIIANTPFVYGLDKDPTEHIRTGDRVRVDGDKGTVEVVRGGGSSRGIEPK